MPLKDSSPGRVGETAPPPGAERDKAPPRLTFYAPTVVGRTQRLTPEGFLVCEAVPIARIGEMLYAGGEVPVEAARDGLVRIFRDAEEVFRAETIASFLGKPVTDDHPAEDVTPENWRSYAVGVTTNVRRGEGGDGDFLLADLLIQDAGAIAAVQSGKREISCGYDADYEQTEPGRGRQLNIIGNHVALVDRGRCGPRCAIQDKETVMTKRNVWDRLRTAFKANDAAAFDEEIEEAQKTTKDDAADADRRVVIEMRAPETKTRDADEPSAGEAAILEKLSAMEDRISKLESARTQDDDKDEPDDKEKTEDDDPEDDDETKTTDEDEEADEDDKKAAKTGDSVAFQSEFTETVARAEILSPGIRIPTFDAKASGRKTRDGLCALRRKALDAASRDDKMRVHLKPFVTKDRPDFSKMTCDAVALIFNGAAELARIANNRSTPTTDKGVGDSLYRDTGKIVSSINKRNADFWSRR